MNLKKIASGVFAATAVMAACVAPATATPVTFADFSLRGGTANPFRYTNSAGPNSTFTLVSATIPVTFTYQVPNAYGASGTSIKALLSFSGQVNGVVTKADGTALVGSPAGVSVMQKLKNVTFTFTAITAGNIPGTNLLTTTASTGALTGRIGGRTLSFGGDTGLGDSVNYSSDFLNFTHTIEQDFNFSFTSLTNLTGGGALAVKTSGNLASGKGNFVPFSTSGTGTFDSDPAPLLPSPEPAPVAAFLIGGMGLALLAFRGRKASRLSA
ncbi:MAG: hypothetical protein ABIY70_10405 [Capsulimonas sp.]|uniref:hypothetical protein n=1 Tax=Capsulimonas sp. TaxID=2494211 RepID=UPI003263A8E5